MALAIHDVTIDYIRSIHAQGFKDISLSKLIAFQIHDVEVDFVKDLNKLAGQTLVYGLGTMLPRFLNYALLTPFYTRIFKTGEYGIVTEIYAYMALFLVILTYGMETGFFRFAQMIFYVTKGL